MSDARRRGGTYGVYDRMGDFVGTACADAGRALIGGETYLRDAPDREALLELADEMDRRQHDVATAATDGVVDAWCLREYADLIREACGEAVRNG